MPKPPTITVQLNWGTNADAGASNPGAAEGEVKMSEVSIQQTDGAENALPRHEREAERKRQHRRSLAAALRDSVTLRNLAHPVRDRDGRNRINALLDDVFDLREDLIAWCED